MTNEEKANLNWTMVNDNPLKLDLFSSSDLMAELRRRGYNISGVYEKDEMKRCMTKAFNAICWDNWEDEDTGEPNKLGDVYYCKLEWIKETINEEDEMYSIIEDLQETIVPILNLLDNE